MLCEICGEKKATSKSKVDGLQLSVCDACAKFGIGVYSEPKKKEKTFQTPIMESDILPDYSERLRHARENKGMSLKELANAVFEKKSVVEKVESGRMLPDDKLTKKLEKFFNIKIRGAVDLSHHGSRKTLPSATLGDLAKIKEK